MAMANANEAMVKKKSHPWARIEEVAPSPLLYPHQKKPSSSSSPSPPNSSKLETIREDRAEECNDDDDDDDHPPIADNNTIPISAFCAGSPRSSFSSSKKCSNIWFWCLSQLKLSLTL